MAAVLQFRRKVAPASWANEELAEFYRIVDVMGRAGLAISVDVGVSDEDEPWVAFVREDTGDVLAHIARIDGWIVAVSAATNEVVRAQSLKEVVRRIVDTHPLVLLPAHRPGSHIHVHPCAVLAAFIAAAYVLAEGVRSEVHAREFAESLAADQAAATAAAVSALPPPKVAAHPNPLRSALTSISDYLRGVGDLVQPVSINATSANAAIAAVVALVLSGDETGSVASHAVSANEASIIASLLAGAAATAAEAQDEAVARSPASQHVVGLDASLVDPELKADLTKTQERFSETRQPASHTEASAAAPREHAQADGSYEIVAQAQVKPAESVVRLSADLAVVLHAVAPVEVASDRAAKPAASESISTAPSTVAGTTASSAAKSDYASAASTAIAGSATSATTRAGSTDSATDHNGLHVTGQGETTVLRLSDISKYALSALRISDALISSLDRVKVSTAKIDLSDATIVATASLTADSSPVKTSDVSITAGAVNSTPFVASTSVVASVDLTSSVVKAPSTNAAYLEVSDASVMTTTSSVAASSSSAASVVTPASQSSTVTTTAAAPTARPSTAYDIITGILTFAFGDHPTFSANAAARAEISQDLARHGMSTTSQRVLIFSSETVTVPVFELMPGVVLVDGQEIAKENRSAHALDVTSASKVIYLPDGGTLNLIGVIDFPLPV
jgi:hypothetical protein